MGYNSQLFTYGFNELVDLIVPINLNYMNKIHEGNFNKFDKESLFHASSIPALAIHDFFSNMTFRDQTQDLKSVLHPFRQHTIANVALQSIKAPFGFNVKESPKYISEMFENDKIYHEDYMQLSSNFWNNKMDQRPLHTNITWNGSQIPNFSGSKILNETRNFLGESMNYQGFQLSIRELRTVLPIPFPRTFTRDIYNEVGNTVKNPLDSRFMESLSSVSSVYMTGDLTPVVRLQADLFKRMPLKVKMHLKKDAVIEQDDFAEIQEKLENIYEAYDMINLNRDEGESSGWGSE